MAFVEIAGEGVGAGSTNIGVATECMSGTLGIGLVGFAGLSGSVGGSCTIGSSPTACMPFVDETAILSSIVVSGIALCSSEDRPLPDLRGGECSPPKEGLVLNLGLCGAAYRGAGDSGVLKAVAILVIGLNCDEVGKS